MTERSHILAGDILKGREAYVHLVWGIWKDGRCDLIAIATNDETLARYKEVGERNANYMLCRTELVMLDHAFGRNMLPNVLNHRGQR